VATVSNSTCTGNKADRFAGAVFLSGGGTVSNVVFNNNSATSGGAIYTQVSVNKLAYHCDAYDTDVVRLLRVIPHCCCCVVAQNCV
jgi:predicted outer membrane repeat protein